MTTDTPQLLARLLDAQVEFVVIGGTAALVHGATTPTVDLDIAAPMTESNLGRLMKALDDLNPKHATRRDLGVIWQSAQELSRFRMLLIDTDIGRLDVLGQVQPIGGFDKLETIDAELLPGRFVRVLALDQLIEIKASLNRPKDRLVELELRALREELGES